MKRVLLLTIAAILTCGMINANNDSTAVNRKWVAVVLSGGGAQSQWQQARSNLIEAQTQLKIYETEYLRVTGLLE